MPIQYDINERILNEIDQLETDADIKEFLKEVLQFEIDIIDKGKPEYRDAYLELINRRVKQ